jgi:hypothetical protein
MSEMGQRRLWPAGGWHSRSTPSSGNIRAFRHLHFVPTPDTYTGGRSYGQVFWLAVAQRLNASWRSF